MNTEEWYYPRTEFAELVYRMLGKGPAEGIRLFGPRRTGKTSFLVRDLVPLIEKNGHRAIYTSFWPAGKPPVKSLLESFKASQSSESVFESVKSYIAGFDKRIRLRVPGGAAEVEFRPPSVKKHDLLDDLQKIDRYCKRFASDSKPTFLLFDEFQELAKAEFAELIIGSLRTSIDIRKPRLLVVFAGSNQHTLREMFTDHRASFYRYGYPMSMPALDDRFVDCFFDEIVNTSSEKLDRSAALRVFNQLDMNPLMFKYWILARIANPDGNEGDIIARALKNVAEEFGFDKIWSDLTPAQRLVAKLAADEKIHVFNEGGRMTFESETENVHLSNEVLLEVAHGLVQSEVLDRWNGDWQVGDPLFKAWIKSRPDEDG